MSVNTNLLRQFIDNHSDEVCAFAYDLDGLSEHIQQILQPLPQNVQFYYAIKANSDRQILQTLLPHVYGFEVASMGEIEQVRSLCANKPIAFGGPGKTITELKRALELNVQLFHLESELQLARLNSLAKDKGLHVRALLRVNPDFALPSAKLQMAGTATQFGMDQNNLELLLANLGQYPNVIVEGFHFHCISNNLDYQRHAELVERYLSQAKLWQHQFKLPLKTLNIGGGIGVTYQDEPDFEWQHYCTALDALLKQHNGLSIAMECGRFVTANCGVYMAEITDLKQNHGEHFGILRGGNHHFRLPSSWQHNHPFYIHTRDRWSWEFPRPIIQQCEVTLCGELCTPKDVLARNVPIQQMRVGDVVVFNKAGAYGWHISHHDFLSHPHPKRVYFKDQSIIDNEGEPCF